MEDAGTLEEDDIDSQDSNTLIDHGHVDRNCSIKFITPAVKASVISLLLLLLLLISSIIIIIIILVIITNGRGDRKLHFFCLFTIL